MGFSESFLTQLKRGKGVRAVHDPVRPSSPREAGQQKPTYQTEAEAQAEIIARRDSYVAEYPKLEMLVSSQAGMWTSKKQARQAKAAGMPEGFPDLQLHAMAHGYGGLFIELKVGKNRPTQAQRDWIRALNDSGYYATVAWEVEPAWQLILWYIGA